jgi:hypothetical protein
VRHLANRPNARVRGPIELIAMRRMKKFIAAWAVYLDAAGF